ncbi:(Fe-S)-binding protein [Dethiosulfatarculus sandiegensis]|uniref:Uncharacterized protein n=1 Tax=Dethiosulfatarculus sandiegensis TaxID=1429043 RepID=A0A0D2K0A1_9BACT|nr:(Fe-S)-binding protein [Dethiosulfatarculus sandiegensis]KIX15170.1 hypothetical protein X474_05380 [Dethiosulfatarculus sandiegensis]
MTESKDISPKNPNLAPVETASIKAILKTNHSARLRTWLEICTGCGLCADACLFYLTNDKDPKMSPAYKARATLGEMIRKKGKFDRDFLVKAKEIAFGDCTLCRRCSMFCPFGIDIAAMIMVARTVLDSQGEIPQGLKDAKKNILATGNQMGMPDEEWLETCEWMADEYGEDVGGIECPADKPGVKYMYTVNPREPMFYPQDMGMMFQIFKVARESWTVPSKGWDDTNLAMFCGDKSISGLMVKPMYDQAVKLGVKYILTTECGHAYRSAAFEGPYYLDIPGGNPPVPVKHAVQLLWEYVVRDKRVLIDPEKRPSEGVTIQDPCNISRNGGLWVMMRELAHALCPDFRDPDPKEEYNHCCGGGGGYIPMGPEYKERRMTSGRLKAEQLKKTGAKTIIVACHNCFDQITDLNKKYELGLRIVSFKELIVESMIIPEEMRPAGGESSTRDIAEPEAKGDAK